MKKMVVVVALMVLSGLCFGQQTAVDTPAHSQFVRCVPTFWKHNEEDSVRRVYINTVTYDLISTATVYWELRDSIRIDGNTSNFHHIDGGTLTLTVTQDEYSSMTLPTLFAWVMGQLGLNE